MKVDDYNKNTKFRREFLNNYIDFCLRRFENEDNRMLIIERKIYQLLNNSGIIVSIIAIFGTILYNQITLSFWSDMAFLLIFLITLFPIGKSIFIARKIFKSDLFPYMDLSPKQTFAKNFKTIDEFKNDYIHDLIHSIDHNELSKELLSHYLPQIIFQQSDTASDLPLLKDRFDNQQTYIYVCQNRVCLLPVTTVDEALTQLENFSDSSTVLPKFY